MVHPYRGSYYFTEQSINTNAPSSIGVYYCGYILQRGGLKPLYIGRSNNIEERLLNHLANQGWQDVTHFGYHECDTEQDAMDFEASEITKYKPKYNDQGT
jgi:excinuclease UvrABC nuclease subunit